jgi:hypothetical protein
MIKPPSRDSRDIDGRPPQLNNLKEIDAECQPGKTYPPSFPENNYHGPPKPGEQCAKPLLTDGYIGYYRYYRLAE